MIKSKLNHRGNYMEKNQTNKQTKPGNRKQTCTELDLGINITLIY